MLVIGPDGNNLGSMSLRQALDAARKMDLDLVEVSPQARPPVCRILDYGKFRYETAKRDKDSKKHNVAGKVKELKFHINIDEHDYIVKLKKAERFMLKGMKVKMAMVFRGREMQHKNLGKELLQKIQDDLVHVGAPDSDLKMVGRHMTMMLSPLPEKKRIVKYTKENEELEESELKEKAASS